MITPKNSKQTLAKNVSAHMRRAGHTQASLAKETGVSQRTIGNVVNVGYTKSGSTLCNIEKIADVYQVEPWMLLLEELPDTPNDIRSLERLVKIFCLSSGDDRDLILRISERTAAYANSGNDASKGGL